MAQVEVLVVVGIEAGVWIERPDLKREPGEDFVEVDHEGPGEGEDDRNADEQRVVACVLRNHTRRSGQDNAAERALQQRLERSSE
eukprot:CAMPEP_0119536232 /NCGR_PEP_ID=MMETSP1344-20130328/49117_1 /TAXON_ID=236787 /ORGANISM="Florenciella parvula, Strain CCMP2471" /LENGTH=84 /DNA_ID=CAMNT_0007578193 /DNA_START=149 /DNA_END=405 /DNA_ORIENTATION=+